MRKLLAVIIAAALLFGAASAEWVICKPGDFVNVRREPAKNSEAVGYLEAGDEFRTDGTVKNGFLKVTPFGENGAGWIFAGFVSEERPEKDGGQYVCTAKKRVACRRWANGPRIRGRAGWLYNGGNVRVYYRTGEWSVTSRGYIRSEWLEADPE